MDASRHSAAEHFGIGLCLSLAFTAGVVVLGLMLLIPAFPGWFPLGLSQYLEGVFAMITLLGSIYTVRLHFQRGTVRWWACLLLPAAVIWASISYVELYVDEVIAVVFNLNGSRFLEPCSTGYFVAILSPMVLWGLAGFLALTFWLAQIPAVTRSIESFRHWITTYEHRRKRV